jgi:hypothetical protein
MPMALMKFKMADCFTPNANFVGVVIHFYSQGNEFLWVKHEQHTNGSGPFISITGYETETGYKSDLYTVK